MNHSTNISDSASMVIQGFCPLCWHIPSDEDFVQLCGFVGSVPEFVCGSDAAKIAKALASTTGWNTAPQFDCVVGNNLSTNNASGFSALPAGSWPLGYYWYDRNYGKEALFWTSTISTNYTYYNPQIFLRALRYNETDLDESDSRRSSGFSVRCVCD